MRVITWTVMICLIVLTGCSTTGNIGVVARGGADPLTMNLAIRVL